MELQIFKIFPHKRLKFSNLKNRKLKTTSTDIANKNKISQIETDLVSLPSATLKAHKFEATFLIPHLLGKVKEIKMDSFFRTRSNSMSCDLSQRYCKKVWIDRSPPHA